MSPRKQGAKGKEADAMEERKKLRKCASKSFVTLFS
jgi:hypothetical protein